MSAIGTKRTWPSALHMSAFGGKASILVFTGLLAFSHNKPTFQPTTRLAKFIKTRNQKVDLPN